MVIGSRKAPCSRLTSSGNGIDGGFPVDRVLGETRLVAGDVLAHVLAGRLAVVALAAIGAEVHGHPLAHLEFVADQVRAQLHDGARRLVPGRGTGGLGHQGAFNKPKAPVEYVGVGTADAAVGDLYLDLPRARSRLGDFFDPHVEGAVCERGFHRLRLPYLDGQVTDGRVLEVAEARLPGTMELVQTLAPAALIFSMSPCRSVVSQPM